MGFKGKWVFKCLGCKTKDQDDTEYVDLSRIKSVDEIIHINDLVVSKPDLYVDKPNSIFIQKKSLSDDGRSFAAIKPTIAIPIKNKWPSDISSNDSIIKESKKLKNDKKSKRKVIPISNIPGLLDDEYKNNQITISQSIAIAENIYQNERKQIMNYGNENEKSKTFTYLDSQRLKLNEYQNPNLTKNRIIEEFTFSDDESTSGTISMSGSNINENQEDGMTHICYMSDYGEDEESLTGKIWNMFITASKFFNIEDNTHLDNKNDKIVLLDKNTKENTEQLGSIKKGCKEQEWITNNYKITTREASEIVEGAIKNLIKTNT